MPGIDEEIERLRRDVAREGRGKALDELTREIEGLQRKNRKKIGDLDREARKLEAGPQKPETVERAKKLREKIRQANANLEKKIQERIAKFPEPVQKVASRLRRAGLLGILALLSLVTQDALAGLETIGRRGTLLNGLYLGALKGKCGYIKSKLAMRNQTQNEIIAELGVQGVSSASAITFSKEFLKLLRKVCP